MFRIFNRLIFAAIVIYGGIYTWNRFQQAAERNAAKTNLDETGTNNSDAQKKPFVAIRGPLADLAQGSKSSGNQETEQETQPQNEVPRPYTPSAKDHIVDSPVGTSERILHRTFPVGHLVHVAFDIPPHAVTPRFHGTFSSYLQGSAAPSHGEDANVDMLLMNEQQYAAFAAGHDPDVLLIADTSHYQDINFDLAPSYEQTVKYHLVFRNSPGGAAKKLVKADFAVDF